MNKQDKQEWQRLSEDKEIKMLAGVVVIRPADKKSVIPLFCPCCSFPMKVIDDSIAYREFECCHHCELKFARTNKEKWINEGWRPDKSSERWIEYITSREELFKPSFIFS